MIRIGKSYAYCHSGTAAKADRSQMAEEVTSVVRRARSQQPLPLPRMPIVPNDAMELLAKGALALQLGNFGAAVMEFRKAAYVAPEDPITHFNLGLALDQWGRKNEATRAFKACRVALDLSDGRRAEVALEGYDVTELIRLLDSRIGGGR